jgi:predicted lipoprotein
MAEATTVSQQVHQFRKVCLAVCRLPSAFNESEMEAMDDAWQAAVKSWNAQRFQPAIKVETTKIVGYA